MSDDCLHSGPAGQSARSWTLTPDLGNVRRARQLVRAYCAAAGLEETVSDTVVLITSEAVTNAFLHGRSDARLTVTMLDDQVLVEVGDDNPRHPAPTGIHDEAPNGRGWLMMIGLSGHWGVRNEPIGKTVWFAVPSPARP